MLRVRGCDPVPFVCLCGLVALDRLTLLLVAWIKDRAPFQAAAGETRCVVLSFALRGSRVELFRGLFRLVGMSDY